MKTVLAPICSIVIDAPGYTLFYKYLCLLNTVDKRKDFLRKVCILSQNRWKYTTR